MRPYSDGWRYAKRIMAPHKLAGEAKEQEWRFAKILHRNNMDSVFVIGTDMDG